MPAQSVPLERLRLLLVGGTSDWRVLVEAAAARLGAALDTVDDVSTALAWLLRPERVYDCVIAVAPLDTRSVDALAGMLNEVTLRATTLLLLGCASCGGANAVRCLLDPSVDALCAALAQREASPTGDEPPLTTAELISALHGGGLRMRFQPILRASDLQPIGLEALARVHTRARGILHPKDFIPATVACGRERVLTSIAAARILLDIGQRLGGSDLFVTINLPLTTVLHEQALVRGLELCAVAGISPSKVMIEVLESRTAPDLDRLRTALDGWRGHGFITAIDDAGPALPHWRELLDLPFDVLKLDGAMVADPACGSLLETIVGEAKSRGRFIIAEGIENEACLERVRPLGVDALQGFLFARPLPALAVPLWLTQWAAQIGLPDQADIAA